MDDPISDPTRGIPFAVTNAGGTDAAWAGFAGVWLPSRPDGARDR
jgi:hypothetical protein